MGKVNPSNVWVTVALVMESRPFTSLCSRLWAGTLTQLRCPCPSSMTVNGMACCPETTDPPPHQAPSLPLFPFNILCLPSRSNLLQNSPSTSPGHLALLAHAHILFLPSGLDWPSIKTILHSAPLLPLHWIIECPTARSGHIQLLNSICR